MRPADAGFAGAKVNLHLHVGALAADRYHPVDSLMVFADVGDRVSLAPAAATRLVASGPFALAAPMDERNLAVRAVRAALAAAGRPDQGFDLHLEKDLPVAAGLGGGSADAAAALRLANATFQLGLDGDALRRIGLGLGADVPACVASQALIAKGRGEQLSPAPTLPVLHAVLANPLVAVPTGPVFAAFDESPAPAALDAPFPAAFGVVRELAEWLGLHTRNDLEAPARRIAPAAGLAVDRLAASPRALLARMSGSGATAFALCADAHEARLLAEEVLEDHGDWWVRPCRLA